MGFDSAAYRILFLLHIVTAIVGFGAVTLNGIYGNEVKKRQGREGLAIFEANEKVSEIGQIFIYLVPIFGLGLVGVSDGLWEFSQTWVWLAIVLYVIAIGISHGVMKPAVKKQHALMEELVNAGPPAGGAPAGPPPQVAQLEANGKRMAMAGATLNVMLLLIIIDMIWKPGI